jgi:uncharacterized delta-60 repeat protein
MRVWRVARFLFLAAILIAVGGSTSAAAKAGTYLDRSFGNRGVVHSTFGGAPTLRALVVQPDGKILVGGSWTTSATGSSSARFLVARYLRSGALDTSFGTHGWTKTPAGQEEGASVNGLALEPDGKIVAVGSRHIGLEVLRYDPNGSLDPSFGSAGVVKLRIASGASAVALEPHGKILVAGQDKKGMVLVRYLQDGSLDRSFGNGGAVIKRTPHLTSAPSGIAVERDRDIVLDANCIRYEMYGDTTHDIILVRYHPDGSLDRAFGKQGSPQQHKR